MAHETWPATVPDGDSVTSAWSSYLAAIDDLDVGLSRAHALVEQHQTELQRTASAIDELNIGLAAQFDRIRVFGVRLDLHVNLLNDVTQPDVPPCNTAQGIRNAAAEAAAFDQAMVEAEAEGSRSPFLASWSATARSVLVSALVAPLSVIAVMLIPITAPFLWLAIVPTTVVLAAVIYRKLCTPLLREWRSSRQGLQYLRRPRTNLTVLGYLICIIPSGLILLYRLLL